jgi:adenine-specific DNA-methyltransferase
MAKKSSGKPKQVEAFKHDEASRKNIPTAEFESVMAKEAQSPIQVAIARRNRDLDPQLVWRGKEEKDASDLVVQAPPIYIQEKVHPKALIDDLRRQTEKAEAEKAANAPGFMPDLFADFNGIPKGADKTEFYQHDGKWQNRMILGDSLQVMASLAEREGLRGQVQCIYIDPPYGIKFNSNFQWSTTSRDVKDGNVDHITREPEQVRAFRDTWRDGIHSYLSYLRDRLTVARELLTESGSIFVQIGDENVHRVRAVMDEVFGEANFLSQITVVKTATASSDLLAGISDYVLWFARDMGSVKYRQLYQDKSLNAGGSEYKYVLTESGELRPMTSAEKSGSTLPNGAETYRPTQTTSQRPPGSDPFEFEGVTYRPSSGQYWKTSVKGLRRLALATRLIPRKSSISYMRFLRDFPVLTVTNQWADTRWGFDAQEKRYVVETNTKVLDRCVLMATDPGDLVLDPTCGSGTTAFVAEEWGRRWITIDTSRVALALARARIIGARYPYYLLADSPEGQLKEGEVTRAAPKPTSTHGNLRHGFVYERVPHITLKSIANNTEIDVIWERSQAMLEPLRQQLNNALGKTWEDWHIPREAVSGWSEAAKQAHAGWWARRIARQKEIDASIGAKADTEYLYDKPYEDRSKVRVAGPFTVESLSPHRSLGVDEDDELLDSLAETTPLRGEGKDFVMMVLDNLRTSGVQQADQGDSVTFTSLAPWPGTYIAADGRYGDTRAAIFVGPEFGTVSRQDLVLAAREAGDADFDVLIACAFNYEAHTTEFDKLGRIRVLKARMNADLHMAGDLKNTGKGNLFVVFGEPDIDILSGGGGTPESGQVRVKINGVDVFHPQTGEVRSDGPEGIACWFIDTDYNEESFFVRHAYFLGANDPYKALKTTLRAEIDEDAWASLHSDTSRWFDKPKSGRIAVKVINHLGDEVMKVFRVEEVPGSLK